MFKFTSYNSFLLIIIGVLIISVSTSLNFWFFPKIDEVIKSYILEDLRQLISVEYESIETYYKLFLDGLITEERAKELTKQHVEASFYGSNKQNYFFIFSLDGTLIAHPYRKEDVGKNYLDVDDKVFQNAVERILMAAKAGKTFAEYEFYKYGSKIVEQKISAIKVFERWGWIIGTGYYELEIVSNIKAVKSQFSSIISILFAIIIFTYVFFVVQNIKTTKERTQLLKKIQTERDRLKTLIEINPNPVALYDVNGTVILQNRAFEKLNETEDVKTNQINYLKEAVCKGSQKTFTEINVLTPLGRKWFKVECETLSDENNEFIGKMVILTDITKEKLEAILWQEKAYQDQLTQVGNRRLLEALIESDTDLGETFVVIMIDLDNFKQINDTYGHTVGDEILVYFSKVIKNSTRKDAIIIRYGGDEFTIIIPESNKGAAQRVIERLEDRLKTPIDLDGEDFRLSFSYGIAVCPKDGEDIKTLIEVADKRLYEAKHLKKKTT
ncbi:diguanylate cyclase domain-containing protein [Fervidobacterium sp.]